MKYLIFMTLIILMIGCAGPQKADLLVRYSLQGEIVQVYSAGNIDQDQHFIVDYEDLMKFLNGIEKKKDD